jgi:hypothetical protein
MLTSCSKLVHNLGQAVRTQLLDGLLADMLQDVTFLLDSPIGSFCYSLPLFNIFVRFLCCNTNYGIVNHRVNFHLDKFVIQIQYPFQF